MITGNVYRIRTTLVDPPKEKIVLCVGGGLFIWFNTDPRRMPGQLKVTSAEVPGITRDCYLNCGRVTVFPQRELDRAQDQGACSREFLLRVIDEVENRATTLAPRYRTQVVQALREHISA